MYSFSLTTARLYMAFGLMRELKDTLRQKERYFSENLYHAHRRNSV